jgi:NAD(P)-dependent dehydrogenase (short-subunit alcohol dehydrogenase family)
LAKPQVPISSPSCSRGPELKRLEGRIALITGASRGLGAAVAERFAAEGARLILVARTPGGLEETDDRIRAKGGEATLVPLDLTEPAGLDQLGAALAQRFGRLDILVGNAAELATLSPVSHAEPALVERLLAVNLVANFRLIRSLDPLLRASDAGRAIFVTAGAARDRKPFWGAYAASKAGLEALVAAYAAETKRGQIRVNLVDPGPFRSRLRATAYPGEDPTSLAAPEDLTGTFVELAAPACKRQGELVRIQAA